MTITLHTSRGELTGTDIRTIITTEWGAGAGLATGRDGYLGEVIAPDEYQYDAFQVLGRVTSARTPDGDVHYTGGDWMRPYLGDPLASVRSATDNLAVLRSTVEDADTAWRDSIRAALVDGQRVVDIAAAAGISRERVYQIRDGR
jgi:hypothetical protein